jgi:DNA-binding transcriptional MerR regulator
MGYQEISRFLGQGLMASFDVYEVINEKLINSNQLGISARNLNYYKTQGLFFPDTVFEKHEHIKFNFTEYVWFNMILELRKFDIGIGVIKEIKELFEYGFPFGEFMSEASQSEKFMTKLPEDVKEEFLEVMHSNVDWNEVEKQVPVNLLSLFIVEAIAKRKSVSFLVNRDGEFYPFSFDDFNELSKDDSFLKFIEKTYISISITQIIKRFISNFDLKLSTNKLMLLNDREAQVIKLLQDGEMESLTVHLDENNTIQLIEAKESYNKLDKESRLLDLILKDGYQTIELKTQDGRIVYCKNIRRIKPK